MLYNELCKVYSKIIHNKAEIQALKILILGILVSIQYPHAKYRDTMLFAVSISPPPLDETCTVVIYAISCENHPTLSKT